MFDIVVFEGPCVLAEFGVVSVFSMAEWCGVVSVYSFEVVLCETDVHFCHVIVFLCYRGLVDY